MTAQIKKLSLSHSETSTALVKHLYIKSLHILEHSFKIIPENSSARMYNFYQFLT